MDSKTIYSRTSKGEDEVRSKTAHLSGDIKRSLLMVDGIANFGEINKRAAPSLRSSLEQMFKELIKGGFIQEKGYSGKISKKSAPSGMIPKIVVPSSKSGGSRNPDDEVGIELDFASEFTAQSQQEHSNEAENIQADAEAGANAQIRARQVAETSAEAEQELEVASQARAKAEAKSKREAEEKARRDSEGESTDSIEILARSLQEARERAEEKARQGSRGSDKEIADAKARQEADEIAKLEADAKANRVAEAKARAALIAQERALEQARARVEAEAKARREAEEKARREAEEKARREAEEKVRHEAEEKVRREAEDKSQVDTEVLQRQETETETSLEQELDAIGLKSTSLETRTTSATVLFFDVIGYTKQPVNKQIEVKRQFNRLVSDCLKELGKSERIILDTGDGAAIGFMQHPEDALKVAMQFRNSVTANQHNDYPDLKVRIGIHLGPISIVKDMNGQSNMVGDGINDAQRVMSFAGTDQVYISRPYYDFISRLSAEYTSLFHYQGALPDKHGREHPVYKLVANSVPESEGELHQADNAVLEIQFEPFNLTPPAASVTPASTITHSGLLQKEDVALLSDVGKFMQPDEKKKESNSKSSQAKFLDRNQAQKEQVTAEPAQSKMNSQEHAEAEQHKPSVYEVKALEEAQAKVWAEAEQRAKETHQNKVTSRAKAKPLWDEVLPPEPQPVEKKVTPLAKVRNKPFPWYKLVAGMIVAALLILFVAPFLMPTKSYIPIIEQLLVGKFHQPVYISHLEGRFLPTPRLDFNDLAIGKDKQISIKQARLDFSMLGLFTAVKTIDTLELEGVEIDSAMLPQAFGYLQQLATDTEFPIARLKLNEGKLYTEGFALSGVGGELNFNHDGKFTQAKFRAEGNKYEWEFESAPLYKTRVRISVHESGLPLLPNWTFDDLTVKGEMTGNELVISEFDGHIMGGTVHGKGLLGWRSGWIAQGSLAAKTITMKDVFKVLNGEMEGTARFQMEAGSIVKLADEATLDGTFIIKDGVINGIDIAETARLKSKENMPGGRTHFDTLSGDLSFDKGTYSYRNLKLDAGVLAANGKLDYSSQHVSGIISAELDFHEGIGPVPLELGGTRDNPTLVAR